MTAKEIKVLKINELNWTFCQFAQDDCVAQIHQGGDLAANGEFQDLYYVNTLKVFAEGADLAINPHKELHQVIFHDLTSAMNHINSQFKHWKFVNLLDAVSQKGSGCDSCVAH